MSEGHSSSGQLSENHFKARSYRPTLMSAPPSRALSFLPSLSAREETVERGIASISAYRRATFRRESIPDMAGISVSLPELSTAILPDAIFAGSGHSTGMELPVILQNIELLLEAKGRKAHSVSKAAGVPDAIRNLQRAVRGEIKSGPTLRTIAALAAELGVSVDELTRPRKRPVISSAPGVRDVILKKLVWLEQQKRDALEELAMLDEAEAEVKKAPKRKIR
jgi:transcriptional regulator with XRE-family HTH domain